METSKHYEPRPVHRDQIIISLGISNYWISIVEECDNGIKELALVHYVKNTHGQAIECVPLNKWFDSAQRDCELTIPLHLSARASDTKYHLLERDAPEAQIIVAALERASKYVYLTTTISTETEK